MTNLDLAKLLRKVAAAYQILGENRFKIIAYERAADSIEHLTSEVKDYWDDGKLDEIPGVGAGIAQVIDEIMKTGKSNHIEDVLRKVPPAVFPLLQVPGLGPKKAFKLVTILKLNNPNTVLNDLEKAAKVHKIAPLEHFGEKSEEDILAAVQIYKKGQIKENRMMLDFADSIASNVITHIKKIPGIKAIDVLGSSRRRVATSGDIDIAVATNDPELVIKQFLAYPYQKLIERGPTGASLLLHNGRQVDVRVQKPEEYGAMLQYFTGSKNHNIALREFALIQGKSLNEYGITESKRVKGKRKKFITCDTEEKFYKEIGLAWIAPELREDKGEIEAALRQAQGKPNGLPVLVTLADIKGDLHIHTNYNLSSSHDIGAHPLKKHLDKAKELGYEYIGISDHNPSTTNHTEKQIVEIMKRRKEYYEHTFSSWNKSVRLFNMCEVDISVDGSVALPKAAFEHVDAVIVSIHSSFNQSKVDMTKRAVRALTAHPKVRIFGHPTGRLLGKREGVELDWKEIFAVCKERDIALEINANPSRLDLPDTIVFDARKEGLRFTINTDAHAVDQMDLMQYGVSVARRGWCEKRDIVNTMEYTQFRKWLIG